VKRQRRGGPFWSRFFTGFTQGLVIFDKPFFVLVRAKDSARIHHKPALRRCDVTEAERTVAC